VYGDDSPQAKFILGERRRRWALNDLERTSWYRFRHRQELHDRLTSLDQQRAALAPDVADAELMAAFFQQRQNGSQRNPAHPEVLPALEQYSAEAARAAVGRAVPRVNGWWDDETWSTFPEVAALMTPARARTLIQELVEERAAVAADRVYLYRRFTKDGQPGVRVQHRASGLRADFWKTDDGENMGRIYAKPYSLGSIDWEDDDPDSGYAAWYTYGGLGIGRRIYQIGAMLMPDLRWGASSTQNGAIGVRAVLHAAAPYRWEDEDELTAFADHPRTAPLPPVDAVLVDVASDDS
jgi:hypothetical protein